MTVLQFLLFALSATAIVAERFNVTAITAHRGVSVFECWQMDNPFTVSTQPGLEGSAALQLGDVSNITYSVVSAGIDGGWRNAPYPQWLVGMTGSAYVTVPGKKQGLYINGGEFGLIFAADTADVSRKGHRSQYIGNTDPVFLQIPTNCGQIPHHITVHQGICRPEELRGIRHLF